MCVRLYLKSQWSRLASKQSIQENGMPFNVSANRKNTYGRLSKYADPQLAAEEQGAYEKHLHCRR